MHFFTPVIFAAIAVLATVQALPAGTNGEKGLENQGDTVEGTQDHTDKTKNKIGFDDINGKIDHLTSGEQVGDKIHDEEGSELKEEIDDDIDDASLLDCLKNDDLEDCPDLDGFNSDSCLLLPDVDCLKKAREFLDNSHEA